MRRLLIGALILVAVFAAAFAVVFVLTSGPTLPTTAVLAYEFKAGTTATYDVSVLVTTTVSSGGATSVSHTKVEVVTHATVLRTDSAGAAVVRVSVAQPAMTVD